MTTEAEAYAEAARCVKTYPGRWNFWEFTEDACDLCGWPLRFHKAPENR